jgi:hypothetical protein
MIAQGYGTPVFTNRMIDLEEDAGPLSTQAPTATRSNPRSETHTQTPRPRGESEW